MEGGVTGQVIEVQSVCHMKCLVQNQITMVQEEVEHLFPWGPHQQSHVWFVSEILKATFQDHNAGSGDNI